MGRDGLWSDKHAPMFRRNTLPTSPLELYILQIDVPDSSETFAHTTTYIASHDLHHDNLRVHTEFHSFVFLSY